MSDEVSPAVVLEFGLVDHATEFLHVLEVGLAPSPARCREQILLQGIRETVMGSSE